MSLHVLLLVKGLGPGGAERLLVNQVAARGEGIEYEAAYLLAEKDHLVRELEAQGVAASCLGSTGGADLRWVLALRRRLARGDVDVVHVHSPFVAGWTRLVVRTLPAGRRPVLVYTEHNRWPQYSVPTRWLNRLTYSLDDWQIAVSDGVRDTVTGSHRVRVETIVHGIDPRAVAALGSARSEVRAEWGVDDDTMVVGTVANLRVEKAYPDLVAAARLVPPDLPVVFVAIGQGPEESEIRQLLGASGLGDRFRLLGYRPDAPRLASGFDLFVLSSHHEGLPVAVMEAQALGLPIVATAVGGLPEAVTEGVDGRLVPPGHPELLAAAITEVLRDPAGMRTMGEEAQVAASRFDMAVTASRLEEGYRTLVAARRSAADEPGDGGH